MATWAQCCHRLSGAVLSVTAGRSRGGSHRGATCTFALGNAREKGPTNCLCSTANVGSTMCSTSPGSSRTSATHSLRMHLLSSMRLKCLESVPVDGPEMSSPGLERPSHAFIQKTSPKTTYQTLS